LDGALAKNLFSKILQIYFHIQKHQFCEKNVLSCGMTRQTKMKPFIHRLKKWRFAMYAGISLHLVYLLAAIQRIFYGNTRKNQIGQIYRPYTIQHDISLA